MSAVTVTGLVLAAGAGTRFGQPKAGVLVDGERLVDRAVRTLRAGGVDEVLVVCREPLGTDAEELVNPEPERGLRSSLEVGVDEAVRRGAEAVCVVLVDMPGLTSEGVRATVGGWRGDRVALASYAGKGGHPTVMSTVLWRAALALAGPDEGARKFLAEHPDLVDLVPVAGDPHDLDTPADLDDWVGRRNASPLGDEDGRFVP